MHPDLQITQQVYFSKLMIILVMLCCDYDVFIMIYTLCLSSLLDSKAEQHSVELDYTSRVDLSKLVVIKSFCLL